MQKAEIAESVSIVSLTPEPMIPGTSVALNPKFARSVAQAIANFGFATLERSRLQPRGIEMEQGEEVTASNCDRIEIGWGILPDRRRMVILKPTFQDQPIGRPFGLSVEAARIFLNQLQQQIEQAETSQRPAN